MNEDKYTIQIVAQLVTDKAVAGAKALARGLKNTLGGANPMEKAVKTAKRLALSLFGVTTIWRGIIKSVNTYLSVNTELQARLNGMYYALGSLFAPVLEWILNILGTWVLYIDAFARGLGLAGINMKNFNKQASKTSRSLAGFDEINNLTEKSSGGGSNITDPFKGLSLGDFGEKVYAFGEWCKNHLPTVIGLLTGLGVAFLILKSDYGTFADSFGITLILTGIIGLVQSIISYFKDPTWDNFKGILISLATIVAGVFVTLGGVPALIAGIVAGATALFVYLYNKSETFRETIKGIGNVLSTLWKNFVAVSKEAWDKVVEKGKKAKDDIVKFFKNPWTAISTAITDAFANAFNGVLELANKAIRGINSIFGTNFKTFTLLSTSKQKNAMSSVAISGVRGLATGTNYVPNDQLAYIHQGEAVIPKKFNSSEYFNSDETNALLQELIERVDNIELNPYVTVKDVGQASVKYINQQARIKGGSVL